jgi:hypothetical protein
MALALNMLVEEMTFEITLRSANGKFAWTPANFEFFERSVCEGGVLV